VTDIPVFHDVFFAFRTNQALANFHGRRILANLVLTRLVRNSIKELLKKSASLRQAYSAESSAGGSVPRRLKWLQRLGAPVALAMCEWNSIEEKDEAGVLIRGCLALT